MSHEPADIAIRLNLRQNGGRWSGICPKCGGSAGTDRFSLYESGGFKCYACDFKGNRIKWLREMEGLTCPEAHRAAGQRCDATTCPVYATCSEGRGEKRDRGPRRAASTTLAPETVASAPRVNTPTAPADLWHAWAADFCLSSARQLPAQVEVMAWLEKRGLDATTARVQYFGLGWNHRSVNIDRASIGLTPEKDGKNTLWIPAGLVIPTNDLTGQLQRLRIRRTDDDRARFNADLKYVWIEGSSTELMILPATGPCRGVMIIEAELDAMACAAAHPGVTVIALGTVNAAITPAAHAALDAAPVILVALDADPARNGLFGAGPKAVANWTANWSKAKYWPTPYGKDPGEYAEQGGDLFKWIESGLPAATRAPIETATKHENAPSPLLSQSGGAGFLVEHQRRRSKAAPEIIMCICADRAHLQSLWREYPTDAVVCTDEINALAALGDLEAADFLRVRAAMGPETALISSTQVSPLPEPQEA